MVLSFLLLSQFFSSNLGVATRTKKKKKPGHRHEIKNELKIIIIILFSH